MQKKYNLRKQCVEAVNGESFVAHLCTSFSTIIMLHDLHQRSFQLFSSGEKKTQ